MHSKMVKTTVTQYYCPKCGYLTTKEPEDLKCPVCEVGPSVYEHKAAKRSMDIGDVY